MSDEGQTREFLGCGDNSCIFEKPLVGTNGGCRCFKDIEDRHVQRRVRQAAQRLRAERDADHRDAQQLRERVRVLEEALRVEAHRQCHRCAAGVPFVAEGMHACDEPTRTGKPCAGHECWLNEDLRALLSPAAATEGGEGA